MNSFSKFTMVLIKVLLVGVIFSSLIFSLLRYFGAHDSGFFAVTVMLSIVIACFSSPNHQVMNGIRRLWLFDWLTVIFVAVFACVVNQPEIPLILKLIHFLCFIMLFLAVGISARRGKTGKTYKPE